MVFYADIYDGRAEMIFTFKSDVYSFGILMHELLTSTDAEMVDWADTNEELEAIERGDRPVVPHNMHPEWRELMERCWAQEPHIRPLFGELIPQLKRITRGLQALE